VAQCAGKQRTFAPSTTPCCSWHEPRIITEKQQFVNTLAKVLY
jgi:hypothetical protein